MRSMRFVSTFFFLQPFGGVSRRTSLVSLRPLASLVVSCCLFFL